MSKPTNVFSVALSVLFVHVVISLAAIMFMPSFSFILTSNTGTKVYSTVTALIYIAFAYSRVWHAGRKDAKHVKVYNNHNENKIEINNKKGLIIGLVSAIPSAVLLIALIISSFTDSYALVNMIYRLFQCTFLGWLGADSLTHIPSCIVVTFIPVVLAIPAYIAGSKEFSLTEKYIPKLVYKQPKKKKNKTQK